MDDKIFFKVWRNIFLLNEIFNHLKLFYKYRSVEIFGRKSLLEFDFLEYTQSIIYSGNDTMELKKSDFPQSGVLERIKFDKDPVFEGIGSILPDGLLKVSFPINNKTPTFPSTFPSSVTFINNFYPMGGKYQPLLELNKNVEWEIIFSNEFKPTERIYNGAIPDSITSLSLGGGEWDNFTFEIREGDLIGANLKSLDLGAYEKTPAPKTIPKSIEKLTINSISESFIEPFKLGTLPIGLTSLHLTGRFNQPFPKNTFPNTLIKLNLSYWYDQPFEPDVLPTSLLTLIFFLYGKYNSEFYTNVLPPSLTDLQLPKFYSHHSSDFSKILPSSLKKISLPKTFLPFIDTFDKSISIKFFK